MNYMKIKVSLLMAILVILLPIISFAETNDKSEYFNEDYWQWHTRTTTNDQAYNGRHIAFEDRTIHFYGYGITSHKDYLYKNYEYAGEKTFTFELDETKGNYHTLDGAGFLFNAKEENGKLTGYALVINQKQITIYRLDNVDIKTFETKGNTTIANYASGVVAVAQKPASKIHQLVITTTPTNVKVIDNGKEILNVNLDYSKHPGEGFGILVSYLQHNCSILTEIKFSEFELKIKDYEVPVTKIDVNGNPLEGAIFQISNQLGEVIKEGTTDKEGKWLVKGLIPGVYSLKEIKAPIGYNLKTEITQFRITEEGKAVSILTGEEIDLKIINEKILADNVIIKKYETGTTFGIQGALIGICDENGKLLQFGDGKDIVFITDETGTVDFASILELEPNTYYYKEVEAPEGYKLNEEIYAFVVNEYGQVEFKGTNQGIIYDDKIPQPTEPNEPKTEQPTPTKTTVKNTGVLPHAGDNSLITTLLIISVGIVIVVAVRYKMKTM